ncbi:MAG: hypothetical protein R3D98_14840 [Candidatus Krumholzibacteriia bacterium]
MQKHYAVSFNLGSIYEPGPSLDEVAEVCLDSLGGHPLVDPVALAALKAADAPDRCDLGRHSWCHTFRGRADDLDHWGLRFEFLDPDDGITRWCTDICARRDPDDQTAFACATWVGAISQTVAPIQVLPGRPQPVRDVLRRWGGFKGSQSVTVDARAVGRENTAKLAEAILSAGRLLPLVYISARLQTERPVVDAQAVADWLAGLAHVVVARDSAPSRELQHYLPEQLLCYDGSVRVYWPRPEANDPRRNMLWRPQAIRALHRAHAEGFREFLLGYIAGSSVYVDDPEAPSWAGLESLERRERLAADHADTDDRELAEIFAAESDALRLANQELTRQVNDLERELDQTRNREQAWEMESRRLARILGPADAVPEADPTTVAEALAQARTRYADQLVFATNSRSEDGSCLYDQPVEVLRAFEFLATTYRDARLGVTPCKNLDLAIREHNGWSYASHQSELNVGRFADWYHTRWQKRTLELREHVGKGSSKDRRRTIRIAFAWDAASGKVVIGFIGQHQKTDAT